jgi:hypothetical protein
MSDESPYETGIMFTLGEPEDGTNGQHPTFLHIQQNAPNAAAAIYNVLLGMRSSLIVNYSNEQYSDVMIEIYRGVAEFMAGQAAEVEKTSDTPGAGVSHIEDFNSVIRQAFERHRGHAEFDKTVRQSATHQGGTA